MSYFLKISERALEEGFQEEMTREFWVGGCWFRDTVRHWKEEFCVLTEKRVRGPIIRPTGGFMNTKLPLYDFVGRKKETQVELHRSLRKRKKTEKIAQDAIWGVHVVVSDHRRFVGAVIVLASDLRIDVSEQLWRKKQQPEWPIYGFRNTETADEDVYGSSSRHEQERDGSIDWLPARYKPDGSETGLTGNRDAR